MSGREKSKKRLISELQKRKNDYLATYKRIKRLVENAAGQKNFDDSTKERFRVAALESNKAHKEFREFLLPFFSDTTIKEVFPEEVLIEENENLKGAVQEHQRDRQVLDALVQELSDKCQEQNKKLLEAGKLQETVTDLRRQLDECTTKNDELKTVLEEHGISGKLGRKTSENIKSEQQDKLIRDLENRLSFRKRGEQNGSRRDRFLQQSLEKIYKINKNIEAIGIVVREAPLTVDGDLVRYREALVLNIVKLEDIANAGHVVVRSERAAVTKKAQALLDTINSKCS